MTRCFQIWLLFLLLWGEGAGVLRGEQRFPPPDFESGYRLPATTTPAARSLTLEYVDVAVLALSLILASYLVLSRRSRKSVIGLSLGSLVYFGFYRKGCICAIGSVQNVALSLGDPHYAVPVTALAFFIFPLVFALFAGRVFCSAVCPHGALQDLVLLKPIRLPSWLEQGLSLVPLLYLGAGAAFAVTGSAFVICQYDPFVSLFRRTGSFGMLALGTAFLLLGIFVGRPYCRFICPYGALLKMAATVSKWRVRITPNVCTQCRLCEDACPYGAIQYPIPSSAPTPEVLHQDRRRLGWVLVAFPVLFGLGIWLGPQLAVRASRLHPSVALAERYLREQKNPVPQGVQTAAALALARAEQDPKGLLSSAIEVRTRFRHAGRVFGIWMAAVIGLKLVSLCLRRRRSDYEPDRGGCLACARCFEFCPSERLRCGLMPGLPEITQSVAPAVPRLAPVNSSALQP
jgi:polyferredoxin